MSLASAGEFSSNSTTATSGVPFQSGKAPSRYHVEKIRARAAGTAHSQKGWFWSGQFIRDTICRSRIEGLHGLSQGGQDNPALLRSIDGQQQCAARRAGRDRLALPLQRSFAAG